jgi:hypothetical protein
MTEVHRISVPDDAPEGGLGVRGQIPDCLLQDAARPEPAALRITARI